MHEYLLVVSPPKNECDKTVKEKDRFFEICQVPSAKFSKPHITVAHFVQDEKNEKLIVERFTATAEHTAPFGVVLKDFGNFPSHCIYINVKDKTQFKSLAVRVGKSFEKIPKVNTDYKSSFIHYPHLTIARGLQPSQFEASWTEFSQKKYDGNFIARNMLLLKRPLRGMKYELVGSFQFTGLTEEPIQPSLFD